MENYVTIFTIVGSNKSLKVLVMKMLLRRRKDKVYNILPYQSLSKLTSISLCVKKFVFYVNL